MSGGPEAHESTGIIFVEKQVRGGKVYHLDKQLGWGLQRPGDARVSQAWVRQGSQISELLSRATSPHGVAFSPRESARHLLSPLNMRL